ncbi:MaoC family dehydratase N-terminal domain-containing protein [Neisseriaceae bacterium TC5R-5]|nr:MaoC family dehydratase N-terminal domain-containing protein [Neisseriaceae bacterium TC5R-5]
MNATPTSPSITLDADQLRHLQSWTGNSETLHDDITAAPLRALSASLDRDDAQPLAGTELPPLWHWLYFLPHHLQSELGPDGHARRGGFLPPVPLPRRMWAGGRVQWQPDNPLRVGQAVQRVSRILSVTHKAGRSGDLLFVQVEHSLHNAAGLSLTEEHDIVYRAAALPGEVAPAPMAAEQDALWQRELIPDPVLLFRYSALTFNGHRIHYDHAYVTEQENYPGLIVHGPLVATLLVDLVRRQCPDARFKRFEFKALRPMFDQQRLRLQGQPSADGRSVRLWAQDHDAWLSMQATAELC